MSISRVLVVHNSYRSDSPSGENRVVDLETAMLQRAGVEVRRFGASSDEIPDGLAARLRVGMTAVWSRRHARAIQDVIVRFRPDVVHVHNTFPLLSPSVIRAAAATGTPVVMSLHNYRLFCAAATALRNLKPCTLCVAGNTAHAVWHRCYRDSMLASVPAAATIAYHRVAGTWRSSVSRFIAVTAFQANLMTQAGLPSASIVVRCYALPRQVAVQEAGTPSGFVLVGRLTEEKGLRTVVEAWQEMGESGPPLTIIGDGPLREWLERQLTTLPNAVNYVGRQPPAVVIEQVSRARYLLQPSLWFEGFPMTIHEAFSVGTPVVASRIGGLIEAVGTSRGYLFEPGISADLVAAVRRSTGDENSYLGQRDAARSYFNTFISEERNIPRLLQIYEEAKAVKFGS